MAVESKVQRVGKRAATQRLVHMGVCGHEVIRVLYAPQDRPAAMRWWCETCLEYQEKGK